MSSEQKGTKGEHMAAAPKWKVYLDDEYRAACKYVEDAAMLVAALGNGATIRGDHAKRSTYWVEGREAQSAAESYDYVAETVRKLYGQCHVCKGEGAVWFSEQIRELADAWRSEEPPRGDGFQLWETTSEGSPASPVFATIEELCDWCADNATTFGSAKASAEEWRRMLDDGFVCHKQGNAVFM